jgi:RecA/RadA recombinase
VTKDKDKEKLDFTKEVTKQFGNGVILSARDMIGLDEERKQIIPLGPALNVALHGGIPEGSWVTCSGQPKTGKEQPVSATVYTPRGARQIGDLKPGDIVCHPEGTSRVVAVFPQGKKAVYRVYFDNGDWAECGIEHLWEVRNSRLCKARRKDVVMTLADIKNSLFHQDKSHKWGRRPRWSVRLPKPVIFQSKRVPIDSYALGLLLGNGSITNQTMAFTTMDAELCSVISEKGRCHVKPKLQRYQYNINRSSHLKSVLLKLGLLGRKSHTKHVPDIYKFNDVSVRLGLLQGLMDTDGTAGKKGDCEFKTASMALASDVKFLIQSLGGLCTVRPVRYEYSGKMLRIYRCAIRMPDASLLFRLRRKKMRCQNRSSRILRRRIVAVEYVRDEQCVCIKVDNLDGLYLTNQFIVTHNTSTALSFAAQCQKPENGDRHVYYLNIEGRLKEMNLRGTAGLNFDKMTIFRSTPDKILTAKDYLTLAMKVITSHPGSLIIIDSVSALCDEKEMDEGIGYENRGAGNKIFAGFCRQAANLVPIRNCIVWAIMHLTQSQTGYGGYVEKGSRTLQYQADVQMRVKFDRPWKVGAAGAEKQIGQQVHWLVESCALGPPGMEVDSYIRYGTGIDHVFEAINLGVQLGLIGKAGAWMSLDFMERHLDLLKAEKWTDETIKRTKTQGVEKLYRLLHENPTWVSALEKEIAVMLKP